MEQKKMQLFNFLNIFFVLTVFELVITPSVFADYIKCCSQVPNTKDFCNQSFLKIDAEIITNKDNCKGGLSIATAPNEVAELIFSIEKNIPLASSQGLHQYLSSYSSVLAELNPSHLLALAKKPEELAELQKIQNLFPNEYAMNILRRVMLGLRFDYVLSCLKIEPSITLDQIFVLGNSNFSTDVLEIRKQLNGVTLEKFFEIIINQTLHKMQALKNEYPELSYEALYNAYKENINLNDIEYLIVYLDKYPLFKSLEYILYLLRNGITPRWFEELIENFTLKDYDLLGTENLISLYHIFEAILSGDKENFYKEFNKGKVNIHMVNKRGQNLLFYAIWKDQLEMFKILLSLGLNPNSIDMSDGKSILQYAASNGEEYVELLIQHGATMDDELLKRFPNLKDKIKATLLPTPLSLKFTRLYIANKENRDAQLAYLNAKNSNQPLDVQDRLLEEKNQKIQLQKKITEELGVPRKHVIKEMRMIAGVQTACYYRDQKTYKDKNRPVLLYTHGDGAAHKMTLNRFDPILDFYVAKGYVVVAPNFREGKEVDDVYSVGMGVRKINDLNIDPSRIFLYSISAGSNVNFRMLEKIGKEKLVNPFAAAQLFSTVGEHDFKDRVVYFPKDIPYLVIHGQKDDIAPISYIKEMYKTMLENGYQVEAYFSPSGNHHLVDFEKKIDSSTSEQAPIFRDLNQWPLYFIPFFEKASRKNTRPDSTLSSVADLLYHRSLMNGLQSLKTRDLSHPGDLNNALSLKYIQLFLPKADSILTPLTQIKNYYARLAELEPNMGWVYFSERKLEDQDFQSQLINILSKEDQYLKQSENKNSVVGYHAAAGTVVGLYFLYNAFDAIMKLKSFNSAVFRHRESSFSNETHHLSLELLGQILENKGAHFALNTNKDFREGTLSLAPTLFSGNQNNSSPIHLWLHSAYGAEGINLSKILNEFLSNLSLSNARILEYEKLLSDPLNVNNGGMFQFFSSNNNSFDSKAILTEPQGARLSFKLSVSEYEQLIKSDPEKLKDIFKQNAATMKNPLGWETYQKNPEFLFSVAQIRIPSSSKFTEKMLLQFYPHRIKDFTKFYRKLMEMVQEDAAKVNMTHSENCFKDNNIPLTQVAPINEIMTKIFGMSDRQEIYVKLHRIALQGDPRKLQIFFKENRPMIEGSCKEIVFGNGKTLEMVLLEEYSTILLDQMLDAAGCKQK